jgi:hypothetical protein
VQVLLGLKAQILQKVISGLISTFWSTQLEAAQLVISAEFWFAFWQARHCAVIQ